MTRAARRTSLLVAFYVLTTAATVSAECAWVLWEERTGILKRGVMAPEWGLLVASQAATECNGFAKKAITDRAERGGKGEAEVETAGNQVTIKFKAIGIERVDVDSVL